MENFEPKIIGFLCNWCSYAGADLAGVSRLQYPANLRVVRVMCSGRVDPTFVFKALDGGADGVLIAGCHPGDCHYSDGNYNTMKRYPLMLQVLEQMGVDKRRVRLEWISAAEGPQFASIVNEFTEQIRQLGPFKKGERTERGAEVG
ncbi:hydrogenase iron-sulfur subunit [Desulfallas thermosapovorans]|uniref:F420-non-reducing hydrogenase subunit D n=1 Tax=Desulfallas thermosapovorans DSM 6562 TaxID=1121431 RepID=A0A5S4ZRP0_9FIRM|nr:hydrogenase iron-sulfur subunit [Desulfallas thermosapovorans]TYO95397.1 F420-non-reducing hydrogenase subunit D [Desulfallas thermosapovorans DSM 6562]